MPVSYPPSLSVSDSPAKGPDERFFVGGGGAAVTPELAIYDTFVDANGTRINTHSGPIMNDSLSYTDTGAGLEIQSNALASGTTTVRFAHFDLGTPDITAEFTIDAIDSLPRINLLLRYADSSNFMFLGFSTTGAVAVTLQKVVSGSATAIGSDSTAPSVGDTIQVVTSGDSIKVYKNRNSTPIIDVTESDLNSNTSFGYTNRGWPANTTACRIGHCTWMTGGSDDAFSSVPYPITKLQGASDFMVVWDYTMRGGTKDSGGSIIETAGTQLATAVDITGGGEDGANGAITWEDNYGKATVGTVMQKVITTPVNISAGYTVAVVMQLSGEWVAGNKALMALNAHGNSTGPEIYFRNAHELVTFLPQATTGITPRFTTVDAYNDGSPHLFIMTMNGTNEALCYHASSNTTPTLLGTITVTDATGTWDRLEMSAGDRAGGEEDTWKCLALDRQVTTTAELDDIAAWAFNGLREDGSTAT